MKGLLSLLTLSLICIPTAQANGWVKVDEGAWAKRDTSMKSAPVYPRLIVRVRNQDDNKIMFDCQGERQKNYAWKYEGRWLDVNEPWSDVIMPGTTKWNYLRYACYNEYERYR